MPDDLATALSELHWLGEVVVRDVVDSTNLEVRRRLAAGAPPGLVVVAARQTAGRGRRGRTWDDVEGGNVAVSVAVEAPPEATLLPLVAALALRDAFGELGLATSLKWPNDVRVVVDGVARKCAGILVEAVRPGLVRAAGDGGGPGRPGGVGAHDRAGGVVPGRGDAVDLDAPPVAGVAVVGIGIDLDWRGVARQPPADAWTSLAEVLGHDVDRTAVVVGLLESLGAWLDALARRAPRVLAAYRDACATLGRRVRLETERHVLVGRAVDLAVTGALVLDVDGREVVVTAGEVVHLHEP